MAARHVPQYITESQIIDYFMYDSGLEICCNEDSDLRYESEDSISGN